MGRTRKTAPKIWPGPECLKSRRIAPGERVVLQSFKSPLTLLARMRRDIGRGAIVLREAPRLVDVQTDSDNHWWWPRSAVIRESDHLRGLNIAMCHAKARARVRRMQRFLEWCRSHGACRRGLDYASARTSPEQAVLDSAESIYTAEHLNVAWCARRCSPEWDDRVEEARWADMRAIWDRRPAHALTTVAEALVRSPEWASLPWQADPSEVTHA